MNNRLTLYQSRYKGIGYSIIFGIFGVLTFLAGIDGQPEALIGSVLCWVGFVASLVKSFNTEPQIVIDENGIADNRKGRFIRWEDIDEIWMGHVYRSHYVLRMKLKNPEKYYQQMPSVERAIWKSEEWLVNGHINVDFVGLNKSTDQVLSHIQQLNQQGLISVVTGQNKRQRNGRNKWQ
jgi:hypothetical protein